MTGAQFMPPVSFCTACQAANRSAAGSARSAARLPQPARRATLCQKAYRSGAGATVPKWALTPPPLDITAPAIRSFASGDRQSCCTLMAPALWPMTVMRAGSPPKAAMLSCTHCSAHSWSYRP